MGSPWKEEEIRLEVDKRLLHLKKIIQNCLGAPKMFQCVISHLDTLPRKTKAIIVLPCDLNWRYYEILLSTC